MLSTSVGDLDGAPLVGKARQDFDKAAQQPVARGEEKEQQHHGGEKAGERRRRAGKDAAGEAHEAAAREGLAAARAAAGGHLSSCFRALLEIADRAAQNGKLLAASWAGAPARDAATARPATRAREGDAGDNTEDDKNNQKRGSAWATQACRQDAHDRLQEQLQDRRQREGQQQGAAEIERVDDRQGGEH